MSDSLYTQEMLDSIQKVEATRPSRIGFEPRRMTAEEKEALLAKFHPDYKKENFDTLVMGPNKGERVPKELAALLQAHSRVKPESVDLEHPDYDVGRARDRRGRMRALPRRLWRMKMGPM